MPVSMPDQFRGLPMGDLIGGPLMAAADAQVRLANATAGFIQQIGFVPPEKYDGTGFDKKAFDIRKVAFKFDRPSGEKADNGAILMETVELDVPLLAVVKIPALSIDTVDIAFDMEVKNSETTKESTDVQANMAADASVGWGPFKARVHVEGSVSSHKENTRQTDQSAKYHVEVHASDKGMPEGLARVLDIMNSAIAPTSIASPSSTNTNATNTTNTKVNENSPPAAPLRVTEQNTLVLDHQPVEDALYRLLPVDPKRLTPAV